MKYEVVIGLEVHAQLSTRSKIFCTCANRYGDPPNTLTCPVCLGMPGTLPVLNEQVIHFAIKTGLALECSIRRYSRTARKNYFYPDLPKGYQISQYEDPICYDGKLLIETDGKSQEIGITRIHIEEDAGKSIHGMGKGTGVDFNRCGVPLIEIVSEPDLRSPAEARAYLTKLKQILKYLNVSDCNMEEGSLRCDANVSLRPVGATELGTKTEVKNMNSFRAVEKALEYEVERQTRVLDEGGRIAAVTLFWNDATEEAILMRSKEEAHDYRYFPEPDLVPISVPEAMIETIRGQLPELPAARGERFKQEYGLNDETVRILTAEVEWAAYFEDVIKTGVNAKSAATWVTGEVLRVLKESESGLGKFPISAGRLGELIGFIEAGKISNQAAKKVFESMLTSPDSVETLIEKAGLSQVSDEEFLQKIIQAVMDAHPDELARYREGKKQLMGFFVGQVMKKSRGAANPKIVNQLLQGALEEN
ncbi:MAG: Asp-tRNA(Asn)/Glu-tRNA(Gln) amidotransferase subunit GatB [Candidatus Marinimicrobia bacterium]|nr:Asp-tRNA(Asn)/Glu-tRNA(Gln) amidotransferase subunit GatB [Candidatus Neomarinimicrobiota bacterium]MCF7840235.1 Asp-tRNA(Asn)/Glu-tRNA(Gln) amidotransferase subunit GatB [Candidatus Neomarinimicrobiota bacterium]MCF7903167.1 Asp-tRNA(Asn)/Glu-tRNA(Gln) amidotransferase subunit GatB [Candidatus Neomarinimicrobiota bacterium]